MAYTLSITHPSFAPFIAVPIISSGLESQRNAACVLSVSDDGSCSYPRVRTAFHHSVAGLPLL